MSNPDRVRKVLDFSNRISNARQVLVSIISVQLHEEYLKSDDYKDTGRDLQLGALNRMAVTKVDNDLLLATIVLAQEGRIPPKNLWAGREDIVRETLTNEDDKKLVWSIEHGMSQLCVHSSQDSLGLLIDTIFGPGAGDARREEKKNSH